MQMLGGIVIHALAKLMPMLAMSPAAVHENPERFKGKSSGTDKTVSYRDGRRFCLRMSKEHLHAQNYPLHQLLHRPSAHERCKRFRGYRSIRAAMSCHRLAIFRKTKNGLLFVLMTLVYSFRVLSD